MQAKQMLATMSHEIRSPLSGVVSMAEVLATTDLDAEQRQLVDVMLTSGDLVLQLINNILDLSKIESGERKITFVFLPLLPHSTFYIQSWMILFGAKFVLKIWTFEILKIMFGDFRSSLLFFYHYSTTLGGGLFECFFFFFLGCRSFEVRG